MLGVRGIRRALVSASALALAAGNSAWANDAATDENTSTGSEGRIAEIVVTAQKREQRLQDVPIAITAVTSDTLAVNRVENVTDLTGLAPGLIARVNAGGLASPSIALRGILASSSTASQDRQISQYLDGVYIGGSRGAIFDLPDVERIEVLRGPQGTLFGRNSTGGAVSVITRDPTGEFGLRQDITVGNLDQLRTRTSVDLPAFGDFSAYFTYVHNERRGDVRNLGAGTTFDRTSPFTNIGVTSSPKWLGGKNDESFYAALQYAPGDDFKLTYKFDKADGKHVPEVRTVTALNTNSLVGGLLAQILAAQPAGGGAYGPTGLNPSDRRPDAYNNGWTQRGYTHVQGHNLTVDLRVSDNVTIKNITAYRKSRVYGPSTVAGLDGLEFTPGAADAYAGFAAISQYGADFFAFPAETQAAIIAGTRAYFEPAVGQFFAVYTGNSFGKSWQFSNELQANIATDMFDLTIGAIYYKAKELNSGLPGMAPNLAFTPIASLLELGNVQEDRARTQSVAGYAQADIHLTPQLDLQLGGRITHDKKNTSLTQGGVFTGDRENGTITGTTAIPGKFSVTKPTWSAGINYRPVTDTLVYAKASTGFLSGGAVGSLTFEPETVLSFEGGVKSDLLDRRLRLNLAVWQATYKHNQQAQSGATVGYPELGVVVIDVGTLKSHGVEFEAQAAPVDGLTLSAQLAYTHIKLTDINPILLIDSARYKARSVPKWTGNLSAQYVTQPLFDDATMLFRLDGNYQGKTRALTDPDIETNIPAFAPYAFSPAHWILNGRVALREIPVGPAKAEVAAWARNLTNNRDPLFPFQFGTFLFTDSYQQARTFGLDLIVKY